MIKIALLVRRVASKVGSLYASSQEIDSRLDAATSEPFSDERVESILAKFEAKNSHHKLMIPQDTGSKGNIGGSCRVYIDTDPVAKTAADPPSAEIVSGTKGTKKKKDLRLLLRSSCAQPPSGNDIDARLNAAETIPFDDQRLNRIVRKFNDIDQGEVSAQSVASSETFVADDFGSAYEALRLWNPAAGEWLQAPLAAPEPMATFGETGIGKSSLGWVWLSYCTDVDTGEPSEGVEQLRILLDQVGRIATPNQRLLTRNPIAQWLGIERNTIDVWVSRLWRRTRAILKLRPQVLL